MDSYLIDSKLIKAEAQRLGFFACGIAKARFLEEEAEHFENWLKNGMNASMFYMEKNFDKRLDPSKLVPGAKSVISVLLNYYPKDIQLYGDAPILSKYAFGEDYHFVVKDKLNTLLDFNIQKTGSINARVFTDSAPVLDKKWAELTGIAWRGKHSGMLTRQGSFFFIGEIILDIELEYSQPINSLCGTCTKCINACPTGAIVEPYIIDSGKCISYFTIEHKDAFPDELRGKFNNRLFGCDICQDVCPYNRKPIFTQEQRFKPDARLLEMTTTDWDELSNEIFNEMVKNSPLKRTGYEGIKRNLDFLKS